MYRALSAGFLSVFAAIGLSSAASAQTLVEKSGKHLSQGGLRPDGWPCRALPRACCDGFLRPYSCESFAGGVGLQPCQSSQRV